MNTKEAAHFWGVSEDQLKAMIEKGCELPVSKTVVTLKASTIAGDYQISEDDLDRFIRKFEDEEPGRHPPVAVRRTLLTESRHLCGICRQPTPRFQFHHMLGWEKLKHHDPKHMLALCGTCHDKCTILLIDRKAQEIYKAKLQEPAYRPEEKPDDANVKRERDFKTLNSLFSEMPTGAVDYFFEEAACGYMPYGFSTHYWEGFTAVLGAASFHLYDTTADRLIREFASPISYMMAISSDWMHLVASGQKLTFSETVDNMRRHEFHQAIEDYGERCRQAASAWRQLYTYLRENYLELDFDKTDAAAIEGYKRIHSPEADSTSST